MRKQSQPKEQGSNKKFKTGRVKASHAEMPSIKVALVGRPNVGKSTLFNRLIRANRAITHDMPGVTRDRMEGIVRSRGYSPFALIDTGGITLDAHASVTEGPKALRGFESAILAQAELAMGEASVLCLVVDGREGLTPFDEYLASYIRRVGKPILVVVNKVDGIEKEDQICAEFHGLGFPVLAVSGAHGHNVRLLESEMREMLAAADPTYDAMPPEEFMEEIFPDEEMLAEELRAEEMRAKEAVAESENFDELDELGNALEFDEAEQQHLTRAQDLDENAEGYIPPSSDLIYWEDVAEAEKVVKQEREIHPDSIGRLRVAFLGKPNAGKSSLVNALSGEERMIVSDIAGTTRDSVDIAAQIGAADVTFVDTAGVRRPSKIVDTIERYSVNASLKSTTKSHVTLVIIDAIEGVTQQDKRLIDLLDDRKTPFMVLINKVDLVPFAQRKELEKRMGELLQFCKHVPVLYVSAKTKLGLKRVVPMAERVRQECFVRITTSILNRAMESALTRHQPPIVKRVRAKFFYLTQAETNPPTFVFFVNDAERVTDSYARYLERALRKNFEIEHAPMRIRFRSSHTKNKDKKKKK